MTAKRILGRDNCKNDLALIKPLTQCGWNEMDAVLQATFSNEILLNYTHHILIQISLKCVFNGPIDNKSPFVEIMAWQNGLHFADNFFYFQ